MIIIIIMAVSKILWFPINSNEKRYKARLVISPFKKTRGLRRYIKADFHTKHYTVKIYKILPWDDALTEREYRTFRGITFTDKCIFIYI